MGYWHILNLVPWPSVLNLLLQTTPSVSWLLWLYNIVKQSIQLNSWLYTIFYYLLSQCEFHYCKHKIFIGYISLSTAWKIKVNRVELQDFYTLFSKRNYSSQVLAIKSISLILLGHNTYFVMQIYLNVLSMVKQLFFHQCAYLPFYVMNYFIYGCYFKLVDRILLSNLWHAHVCTG